jgi:hypothetical protein
MDANDETWAERTDLMLKTLRTYWRSHLLPAPAALALVSVAGAVIALGLACAALYSASEAQTFADGVGLFSFVFGVIAMPFASLLLLGAAMREKRALPRGVSIGVAALAVLLSGLFTSVGISSDAETSPAVGAATFLFLFVPPAIVLFGFALYFASKGWPETRAAILADREHRAIQMIESRGEVTIADLAAELGLRVDECDDVVDAALQQERLSGWHDVQRGRVYSAAALRERQSRLASIVLARGQIRLDDLERELSAPHDLVRTWIYELVRHGEFTGYVNWDERLLYSAEAQRLTAAGRCPNCNGELSLAGKGVIRCRYCSSEIFL